jgi:HlyD family secretion protein
MVRKRTYALMAFAAIALVASGFVSRFRASPTPEQTTVAAYYPVDASTVLTASGYTVATRRASLSSKVTGRLAWLGVAEGSRVRTGELIARLEDREYRAGIEQAIASIELARHRSEQAIATRAEAASSHQRAVELRRAGFIADSALDTALARTRVADASVAAAAAEVRVARALLDQARIALDQTRIVAPFDGVVVALNANPGDVVTPLSASLETKGAVVTIVDPASLEVRVDVGEAYIEQVRIGQPCVIRFDALPGRRLVGAVARIVPQVDRAKGTIQVQAAFDHGAAPGLLPDMSARVDLLDRVPAPADLATVAVVDKRAIVTVAGEASAVRVSAGGHQRAAVRTGREFGSRIEVVAGLSAGDVVLLHPPTTALDSGASRSAP